MYNQSKIKIFFLLPSLSPGGAQRVMSFVAQAINKDKFETTLLIAGYKKDTAYNVNNVNVVYLNKKRILTAIPSIVYKLFKNKPDIVISSISHVNTAMSIIAPLFKNTKFIGREATVLSKRKNEENKKKWSLFRFISVGFKNLDMLICQSQDMAEDMMLNYQVPENKVKIINNPISNLLPAKPMVAKSDVKKFITVGRLNEVKGHIRLLEILSNFNAPFKYTLIGDGDLKEIIFDKAKALGIFDNIIHIPFTNTVSDYIAKNDVFLQGSFVEGFPNALLESCVVGTPAIAFNAPGGTKEIIINGVNGFLVDTKDEFLEKLHDNTNWNPVEIRNTVVNKFSKEKIISEYEQLFISVVNTSS